MIPKRLIINALYSFNLHYYFILKISHMDTFLVKKKKNNQKNKQSARVPCSLFHTSSFLYHRLVSGLPLEAETRRNYRAYHCVLVSAVYPGPCPQVRWSGVQRTAPGAFLS